MIHKSYIHALFKFPKSCDRSYYYCPYNIFTYYTFLQRSKAIKSCKDQVEEFRLYPLYPHFINDVVIKMMPYICLFTQKHGQNIYGDKKKQATGQPYSLSHMENIMGQQNILESEHLCSNPDSDTYWLSDCYGLNISVPPKFTHRSPNPQCNGIQKQNLCQIIKIR